tara:strand:+ start:8654 stop:9427 length:774 start_codon:yes stop_codon:yes gene_type:complete
MDNFKLKIGLFDSGIGGFSILQELMLSRLNAEYFYIGDKKFSPYGNKTPEFIQSRCIELGAKLLEKNVDLIIVACNSATTHGVKVMRDVFDTPIVGVEPYVNYLNKNPNLDGECGLITTLATSKAEKFLDLKRKLDPEGKIKHYITPNLASLVEQRFNRDISEEDFLQQLHDQLRFLVHENLKHLILGCTHYPLVKKDIENFLSVKTICPSASVAQRVISLVDDKFLLDETTGLDSFWYSSGPDETGQMLSMKELAI